MSTIEPTPESPAAFSPAALLRRLRDDASLRAIGLNTAWLVADRLLGLAVNIVVTIAFVRYLGPADFGLWSHALAIAGLLAPFVQLGIDGIVVRQLVEEPEAREEILGTAFLILLCCGVALVPLGVVAGVLVSDDDMRVVLLIALLSLQFIFQAALAADFWFRSALQSKYTVWSTKAGLFTNAALTLLLIKLRAPVTAFAAAVIAEAVIGAVCLLFFFRAAAIPMSRLRASRRRAKSLLRAGFPLLVGAFAGSIYLKIDYVILRELSTTRETGIYAAAVRISELWYFLPMALSVSLFPSVVRMRTAVDARQRMQRLYDLAALGGYLVAMPMTFAAAPLVRLIYGADYAGAGPILAVHIWTFLLISLGIMRSTWLVAEDLGRVYMFGAIGGAIVNVLIDLIAIPRYGGLGAAWASIAAQTFIVFVSSLFFRDARRAAHQALLALFAPVRLAVSALAPARRRG